MKKILLFFVILVYSSINIYAQDGHLTFMNIPIDGRVSLFVNKLEQKGFVVKNRHENAIVLKGTFANVSDCEVFVLFSRKTKTVGKVVVYFPEEMTWYSLKSKYFHFKELFDKKYTLKSDYAYFVKPYYDGDGYEMSAVRNNKCVFVSFYTTNGGDISLEISEYRQLKCVYEDETNFSLIRDEKDEIETADI